MQSRLERGGNEWLGAALGKMRAGNMVEGKNILFNRSGTE